MTSMKRNIIANYLGNGWSALMGIVFVPLYIKYLGMEAYGLIGVFAILQVCLTLLDMGMTPTLNREMARYTAGAHTAQFIRDLLRSLEIICIAIALLIALAVWLLSPWLATNWLQAETLPVSQVVQALAIMGLVVALRFVEGLYRGAILGFQKQVWLNSVTALLATMRSAGAVALLAWVSSTLNAYFLWHGLVSVLTIISFATFTHRSMPSDDRKAQFSRVALIRVGRFASGMMLTTLLALMLTQVDKVLLSKLLSLEAFGYYTLAATLTNALLLLVAPVSQALYPRLTELAAKGDMQALVAKYHQGAQLVSVILIPSALAMALFSEAILTIWTGNADLSKNVSPLLTLLAVGTMLYGLMHVPYMLQLAYGWSSFAVRQNVVAVTLLIPAILWAVPRFGAIGAAWAWLALNSGYIIFGIHFMHQKLLPKEKWHWYGKDVLLPLSGAATVLLTSKAFFPDLSRPIAVAWIGITMLSAFGVSCFTASLLRGYVLRTAFQVAGMKHT